MRNFDRMDGLFTGEILRGSEADLDRAIQASLVVADDDIAEVGIGKRERDMLGRCPSEEDVEPVVFCCDAEVIRLHPVLGTHGQIAAQQPGDRAFKLWLVAVIEITTKAKQSNLVRLGQAQGEIGQDALAQIELGGPGHSAHQWPQAPRPGHCA